MIMFESTRIIVLSGLLLSSVVAAAPGGGLIADQTAGTRVVADNQVYTITGGTALGGNLLHSFLEFNVESGEIAAFQAGAQTQQIISRVTGDNNSWINGTIRIDGESQADLYLVNPNGLIFGPEASLDVPGALHASTADYVALDDGQRVYADLERGINLTVAAPEAFGFLDASVADIQVQGSKLSVRSGETVSLIGGELTLESDAVLTAPGGQINLTAVASDGEVASGGTSATNLVRADISIQDSLLNTDNQKDSITTGHIRLRGDQIIISGSELCATNFSGYDPDAGFGDTITLQADKQVVFNTSTIDLDTHGAGNGGTLVIQAPNILLTRNSGILSDTLGSGHAGKVLLEAQQRVLLDGQSIIALVTISTQGVDQGRGGDLIIKAPIIELNNTGVIYAQTFGTGSSGLVSLNATEAIRLSGQETIISSAAHGSGSAGGIQLQTRHLELTNGAEIQSTGSSEFVPPSWMEPVKLPVGVPHTGAAGKIQIDLTGTLHLSGRSEINTSTAGSGSAGDILIGSQQRPAKIQLTGASRILSESQSTAANAGQAGKLSILAQETIELHGGSTFSTASGNAGGGGIQLETHDWLRLQDSDITTSVRGGGGQGGNIAIDPVFVLLENSQIKANAHGGPGGNIKLVADYLMLSGPTAIEASSDLSTSGEVSVQAVTIDGGSLQVVRSVEPLDVAQRLPASCSARHGRIGHLYMVGYDAHPTPADDLLSAVSVRMMHSESDGKYGTKKGLQ